MAPTFRKQLESAALQCGATVACLFMALPGMAAESPMFGTATGASDALEEVIVTAQRRSENLDKVPMSLTAFTQKALDDLHIQSLSDLATIVPGLVVTAPVSSTQASGDVAIRGVFSGGNSATTGIYIDETPIVIRQNSGINYASSPQPDLFDLDRIEVLRGPQGTLFGSGAMGGAIRYITPQPNLNDASGYAKAEFDYTDRGAPSYAVGVAYGAPIVQGEAGFRLSGWYHMDGGFIDTEDPYTGEILRRNANSADSYVFRPAFTFAPTDGLTITPAAFIQRHHSDEPSVYWRTELPNPDSGALVSGSGASVPQPATDNLDIVSLAVKYDVRGVSFQSDTSYTYRSYGAIDDWSNGLQTTFGLPPIDTALSSYSVYDQDTSWMRAWQQEFRVASQDTDSRLSWVGGVFYRRDFEGLSQIIGPDLTPITELAYGLNSLQTFGGVPDYVANGRVLNSYTWSSTEIVQKAVFGEGSFEILPHLKANVGVRVERSEILQQRQIFAGPLDGAAYSTAVLPDQAQTPVTPRFGLSYQYTDQDMIYATAAKGYRAGGSNSLLANADAMCAASLNALGLKSAPTSFDSDSLWSYEIGAKDSFFDRRLSFQASVYYIDWTGIQTSLNLPSCGQFFTANQGKVVSQGFEFQFAAVPMHGLKVSGNVGYDDAYHPNALRGAPTSDGTVPLLVAAGDKVPGVPPWTASLSTEYSRDISLLWAGAQSYLRVDYRWMDAYPKGDPRIVGYDPGLESDAVFNGYPNQAYGILNVRLGVIHGGLDLSAFVNNATNSNPLLSEYHWTIGNPLYTAAAIRPLTVGLTAQHRF